MHDAIVIGGGHAGLALSQRLVAAGLDHLVLERGEIGESWRSQRWDSFTLNTPNAMNGLPGSPYAGDTPEAFEHRDSWIARLERYSATHGLPVRTRCTVTAVESDGSGSFRVTAAGARLAARSVVVASGTVNVPKLPASAAGLVWGALQDSAHVADQVVERTRARP